jgi:hypothetical protein
MLSWKKEEEEKEVLLNTLNYKINFRMDLLPFELLAMLTVLLNCVVVGSIVVNLRNCGEIPSKIKKFRST